MKIFTNEQSWELTYRAESENIQSVSTKKIIQLYKLFKENKLQGSIIIPFGSEEKLQKRWQKIQEQFIIIEAAGGIVKNDSGKLLFILRLGKWDLPKGKIEKGEKIEHAAVREVEEECGIHPTLQNRTGETWHTYTHKGKDILKLTHWFSMHCTDSESLKAVPQTEEDIEVVKWVSPEEVEGLVFTNTYESIKEIYKKY